MSALPEFKIDPSTPLTDALSNGIKLFSLKETIDCLISAIELSQEKLDEESKEYKNNQLIMAAMTEVSGMTEELNAMEVHATHETWAFKVMKEQQKRRRILADTLLNIASIKVI